MDVSEAIRTKRAVRKFRPEPLQESEILAILNAERRPLDEIVHWERW